MTNVPADRLPAEDITDVYGLRWQVELLFKAMRQFGGLGELRSSKKAVIERMVWASVLAVMASQATYRLVRDAVPRRRASPLLRWAGNFACAPRDVLRAVVRGDTGLAGEVLQHLRRNAPDPNINRAHRALGPVFLGLHAQPITHEGASVTSRRLGGQDKQALVRGGHDGPAPVRAVDAASSRERTVAPWHRRSWPPGSGRPAGAVRPDRRRR